MVWKEGADSRARTCAPRGRGGPTTSSASRARREESFDVFHVTTEWHRREICKEWNQHFSLCLINLAPLLSRAEQGSSNPGFHENERLILVFQEPSSLLRRIKISTLYDRCSEQLILLPQAQSFFGFSLHLLMPEAVRTRTLFH